MRAAQAVVAVIVGEIGGPAVMDGSAFIAGDDADGLDGFPPALGMEELEGDVPGRVDVDPVVLAIDPQGGLVHMQGGLGESSCVDGRLLPGLQGLMELHHVVEQGGLGQEPTDQGVRWSAAPA